MKHEWSDPYFFRGRFLHKRINGNPKKYAVVKEISAGGLTVYRAYEAAYLWKSREKQTWRGNEIVYYSGSIRSAVMKARELNQKEREKVKLTADKIQEEGK